MEKSITKGQNFDSFGEFDKVFKTYCDKTHQVYIKRSCRQLKIEDIIFGTAEERELLKSKMFIKIYCIIAFIKVNVEIIRIKKVKGLIF